MVTIACPPCPGCSRCPIELSTFAKFHSAWNAPSLKRPPASRCEIGMLVLKDHNCWAALRYLVGSFSGHCETSRSFIDSSSARGAQSAPVLGIFCFPTTLLPSPAPRLNVLQPSATGGRLLDVYFSSKTNFLITGYHQQLWTRLNITNFSVSHPDTVFTL